MTDQLNLLFVEDSEPDTKLVLRTLARDYGSVHHERVETAEEMRAALTRGGWDAIISDWTLPKFSALGALALMKELALDLPFIIVSGTVGEEAAVDAMRAGASDYVLKDKLARLAPALRRELLEQRDREGRLLAERAWRASEARYRALIEKSVDGITMTSRDGRTLYTSPAARRMFGSTDGVELDVFDLVHPEERSRIAEFRLKLMERPRVSATIEFRALLPDGSTRWIEATGTNMLDEPDVEAVVGNFRDVTERKRGEAQLLTKVAELDRSNEELGHLAYVASHDLQEPLRMVVSYTQLLAKRYKGKLDSDADEFVGFAVEGAHRMQRLIQDLLAYSRIGTAGADFLACSSEEALDYALANLSGDVEERGAVVTHDPMPVVLADGMQLIQLFQHIVGNAIKYQGPGVPRVHISAAPSSDKKWMFSVQDNGLGIDAQYFEKIFGIFQRLHKRDEFTGTGIGLAICRKIAARHGSGISVESQPGQGSTFRFALAGE